MSSLTKSRKEKRMTEITNAPILSDRAYNTVLGLTVLYGFVANIATYLLLGDKVQDFNPIVLLIGYVVCSLAGTLMSSLSDNPLISFIGYNLIVVPSGLILSTVVNAYVGEGMGLIVYQAILLTAATALIMVSLAIIFPTFFASLGKMLLGCLLGLIVAEILALFLFPAAQNILSWGGAILFSLYIGFDYWKAQQYPKTLDNAIDSAVDIYLDMINLFLYILRILAGGKSSKSSK